MHTCGIVAQAPYRFGIFRIFMLNLSVVQMYPNVMSIEHGKVPGLRQKVQELQGEIGLMPVQHWYLRAGWELLYALLGSVRIVKRGQMMSALLWICFASIFIILLFVFVVENGHEDMRPLGRARAPQWWQLAPAALSVAWGDCWPVRETPRRGGLSICDRCKYGDNDKSITSMRFYEHKWAEFGRFVCLWTNIVCYWLGRSNLFVQQKPLRPRKFKNCNSSWQRPAQTIQIRADKNMSADFCHELLLEEMQSRAWELHESCILWCLGRILEWKCSPAKHRELEAERPASTDEGTRESYSNCTVSRKRWDWWWVMSLPEWV